MFCSIWAVENILKFLYNVLYSAQSFQDNRITSWLLLCTISKPLLGCLQTQGRIQDFFQGRGALVSCSTSTPINHIVFFFSQNTSCIRKSQVISGGGGAHPLHPPPRSTPETSILSHCHIFYQIIGFSGENLTYHIVQHNLWHVSLPPRCETWKCSNFHKWQCNHCVKL